MKENENGALNDAALDGVAGGWSPSVVLGEPEVDDGTLQLDPCNTCGANEWIEYTDRYVCCICQSICPKPIPPDDMDGHP